MKLACITQWHAIVSTYTICLYNGANPDLLETTRVPRCRLILALFYHIIFSRSTIHCDPLKFFFFFMFVLLSSMVSEERGRKLCPIRNLQCRTVNWKPGSHTGKHENYIISSHTHTYSYTISSKSLLNNSLFICCSFRYFQRWHPI